MCDSHYHHHELTKKQIITYSILFIFAIFNPLIGFSGVLVYLGIYFYISRDILKKALSFKILDENFLMAIATIGALCLKDYKEAIAVVFLYKIGEFLQEVSTKKSKKSIVELMNLKVESANVIKNGIVTEKKPKEVEIGQTIIVKTGEKVPLDGIINKGEAELDLSALNGESNLRYVSINEEVPSGAIVTSGYIELKVLKPYSESTLKKILDLIDNSKDKKSKSEKYITKFAKIYTPVVVIMAILLAFIAPLLLQGSFSTWIERSLTFLVISCPCALVISIPLSFFCAIGVLSKKAILVKGSKFIELLSKINVIVFDKTGTLTKGKFEIAKIESKSNEVSDSEVLKVAASIEKFSNHPIAKAIVDSYKNNDYYAINNISETPGVGISAVINNDLYSITKNKESKDNKTCVCITKNSAVIGQIELKDSIKDSSYKTIEELKKRKIKTYVLSGDSATTTKEVCKKLKIENWYSNLLPLDKVNKLKSILNPKNTTAYIGDGINDAAVIKLSDIGIAMGAYGADCAIEAADVVIGNDDTRKIISAIDISKKTISIIKGNIIFILSVKILLLVLGALGLMTMWLAVAGDVGVTLLAILNSLTLLKVKHYGDV